MLSLYAHVNQLTDAKADSFDSSFIWKLPKTYVRPESRSDIPDFPKRFAKTPIISFPYKINM